MTDTVSATYGSSDGLEFCGERVYSLLSSHSAFITIDQRSIVAVSSDVADIGEHTITIMVALKNYPEMQTQTSFKVTINPCPIDTLTLIEGPSDTEYMI